MSSDQLVRAVRASAYRIPTEQPESDGTLEWDSTEVLVVEVEAAGVTGLGYSYTQHGAVALVEGKLADVVEGKPARDVHAAWTAMVGAVRNLGATGLASTAISAVDIALWDLRARMLELPLVVALDAEHVTVPIYGSGGFTSYDDDTLQRQLSGWVEAGIPRVKIKTGRDPGRDHERLRIARKAVGDEVELYVDANGAFTVRDAVEWTRIYRDEFGVRWFEEPVSSDDLDGLHEVRAAAPGGIDIAAGEYLWNPWSAHRMVAGRAVDCLQVDVTRCLGITGFLKAAAVAESAQLDVSAHCAPQVSAHASAALRRLRHLEYFHDHVRIESLLFDGVVEPEPGGVLRPDRGRAGHGLALRRADAERFRVG
jgi:L-alanine-DL-glutamate epimerase-like enolase superfamily enzyme